MLDSRQQRTVIPEKQEANEVSPAMAPADCGGSFQAAAQGKGAEAEPNRIPERRQQELPGQNTGEEKRHRDSSGDNAERERNSAECCSACACEEPTPGQGTTQKDERNLTLMVTKNRTASVPTSQTGKPHYPWGIG